MMARYGSLDDGPRPGGIVRATGIAATPHQARPRSGHGGELNSHVQAADIVARRRCEFKIDVASPTARLAQPRRIGRRCRPPKRKLREFALTHWSLLCLHFHDLIQQRGTMSDISIPGGRIRSFVERIEHLDTELQELNESKKEVFAEAKGEGLDVKILKEIIKLRKQDQDERDEHETLLDVYMRAMEAAAPERTAKAA
jgi:uncharacterized protein (UPF0335 family)